MSDRMDQRETLKRSHDAIGSRSPGGWKFAGPACKSLPVRADRDQQKG
jgi:hypothetical protein